MKNLPIIRIIILLIIFSPSIRIFSQESALKRLDNSPRHQEWVDIKQGERVVKAFIVYPQVNNKTLAVLLIHENRGLTDWVRSMADEVAEQGYIAIAPDLLSGMAPDGGKTSDFKDTDAAREAIYKLPASQVDNDLQTVADYALKLDACNGKLVVAGFCWGGGQTFALAMQRPDLKAAFVFYGAAPDSVQLKYIKCPVYGFYGEDDARITSTVPAVTRQMKTDGKIYEPVIYEGAGHAFMRLGEEAAPGKANRVARDKAFERWMGILKDIK